MQNKKNIAIIGASGFAKEVYSHFKNNYNIDFFVSNDYYIDNTYVYNKKVNKISDIDLKKYKVVVAVGNQSYRKNIVENDLKHLSNNNYDILIHKTVNLLNKEDIEIGSGSIICCNSILTCNIKLGVHVHLNLNTTIGHNCIIGNYITTAPGVNISGNCNIGNNVYLGTNCCVKEKINICDNVIIGMGSVVVKDITEPGTYIGVPAKKYHRENFYEQKDYNC